MSTLGIDLIERLRTRSVDVQSQNQFGEGSIAFAKKIEHQTQCETGANGRAVLYVFSPRAQWDGRQPFFGRFGAFERDG